MWVGFPRFSTGIMRFLTAAALVATGLVTAIGWRLGFEQVPEYVLRFRVPLVGVPLIYAAVFEAMDAHRPAIRRDHALWLVTHGAANVVAWVASLAFMYLNGLLGRGIFFLFGGVTLLVSLVWRLGLDHVALRLPRRGTLIVGGDERAGELVETLRRTPECRFLPVGLVWTSEHKPEFSLENCPIYNDVVALRQIAETTNVGCVILAPGHARTEDLLKELVRCQLDGLDVLDGVEVHEALTQRISSAHVSDYWTLFVSLGRVRPVARVIKRTVDIVGAVVLLAVSAPLLALVAVAIKRTSPGPVFYQQMRLGQDGVPFSMLKFRTMIPDAEAHGGPVMSPRNDPRITPVGAILRRTRFDELPQLVNVLRGEMSLVGPRPERDVFASEFSVRVPVVRPGRRNGDPEGTVFVAGWREAVHLYSLRLLVKPGLTGWAQVKYPYAATLEENREKAEYDLFYIKNQSFLLDLSILLRTVGVVLWPKAQSENRRWMVLARSSGK